MQTASHYKKFANYRPADLPRFKYEKQVWTNTHPNASPEEYQKAIQAIAKRCGV